MFLRGNSGEEDIKLINKTEQHNTVFIQHNMTSHNTTKIYTTHDSAAHETITHDNTIHDNNNT